MEDNYKNTEAAMGLGDLTKKLRIWFQQQRDWTDFMVKKNPGDPVWRHASYINTQLDGLYAGYRSVRNDTKVKSFREWLFFLHHS